MNNYIQPVIPDWMSKDDGGLRLHDKIAESYPDQFVGESETDVMVTEIVSIKYGPNTVTCANGVEYNFLNAVSLRSEYLAAEKENRVVTLSTDLDGKPIDQLIIGRAWK